MEYAEGGDLHQLIRIQRNKKYKFTEKRIWQFAYDLSKSIDYLHKNNIIHRDIKTMNVFLDGNGRVKLGDLGVARILKDAHQLQFSRVGTPMYISPEMVKHEAYNIKIDVWAVGCVLYQLAALRAPFYGENLISLGYNICHSQPKRLPEEYSGKLRRFIVKLLQKDPGQRPTFGHVLKTVYFPPTID